MHAKHGSVEMRQNKAQAFCCGGGGGQMWLETDAETRINQTRLDHVLETGVNQVATACPYCLIMFDDALRTRGMVDDVRVMDIAEVMACGLPEEIPEPVTAGD